MRGWANHGLSAIEHYTDYKQWHYTVSCHISHSNKRVIHVACWVNCDSTTEVSDHVPHRTTYGQTSSWVVHEIPAEWLPVRCETNRPADRNLHCTATIDSVLANSKTQNTFLFPLHTMFHQKCPLAVKPASMPRCLEQRKTWRDSLFIDMLLFAVCLGCCAAEFGNAGGTY
jgi:hypothetical protein